MRTLACAVAVLAASLDAAAQADGFVGGRYRLWQAEFEGKVRADDNGVQGSDIDVSSTLDLGGSEPSSGLAAWVGFGGFHLLVDYWAVEYEGDSLLSSNITFAGTTYNAGETVDSDIEWRCITSVLEYGFGIPMSSALLDLDLGVRVGIKYIRINAEIDSPSTGKHEETTLRAPIPVLGFAGSLGIGPYVSAALEVDGLIVRSFGGGSGHGSIIDYALVVRGHLGPGYAGIGWRDFLLNIEVKDVQSVDEGELDVTIRGVFFEVGAKF